MHAFRPSAIVLGAAMSGAAPAAFADRQPAAPPGGHQDRWDAETQRAPDAGPGPGERRGPGGHPSQRGPGLPKQESGGRMPR